VSDPTSLYTDDTLFDGRLLCRQHQKGYRFSVDAVLLAHFAQPLPGARIMDMGTGCGIIALIMAHRYNETFITGLEIQSALARLALDNVASNDFAHRIEIINGDFRNIIQLLPAESFDMVVSNPPFYSIGKGRVNPASEQAWARHELNGDIFHGMKSASFVVKNMGRVCVVYPAGNLTRLLAAMSQAGLTPKKILPVYINPEEERARLVLVEAIKNGGEEMILQAPFYIYSTKNGSYSSQMQEYYR